MTTHSDWQELRDLSKSKRGNEILNEALKIQSLIGVIGCYEICGLDDIADAQQHLDRIKALVMSKPS